jgi:hypothetical protein
VLEPRQNALDVSTNLRKNRDLLSPNVIVSRGRILRSKRESVPIICQVQNMLLCSNSNFLEDLLAGMFADMVTNHDSVSLPEVSHRLGDIRWEDMPLDG